MQENKFECLKLAVERWKNFNVTNEIVIDTADSFVLYLERQQDTNAVQNPDKGRTTRKKNES